jgi:hypothetical protein
MLGNDNSKGAAYNETTNVLGMHEFFLKDVLK